MPFAASGRGAAPGSPSSRRATGDYGEDLAARHLRGKGYKLLARNWRKGSYELDLVCAERGTLVFVEVKTRGPGSLGAPSDALTPAKKQSFLRAAQAYLGESGDWDAPCRFDLVCVNLPGQAAPPQLEHFENVLELNE